VGARLIVALRRTAKLLGKQVVTLQLGEGSCLLPLAVTKNPGHGKLGVVIENPRRNAAQILEGAHMSFEESFGRLCRKSLHETIIRVRQVEGHEVRLLLDAVDDHQRFAEVGLRLARRMAERHKHLLTTELGGAHIVLHDRVAARVTVLGSKPFEDPLGRVALFARPLLVVFENGVDHALPRA
jgi:hypothetical protein